MLKLFLIEPPISVQEYEIDNETKYTIWLPPLWAIALSAFLKKRMSNIKIEFLDGQLRSFSEIKNQIVKEKPDFVGISPKDKTYQGSLKLARISKQTGAKVILGGLHADSLAKEIIKNRGPYSSDYCIVSFNYRLSAVQKKVFGNSRAVKQKRFLSRAGTGILCSSWNFQKRNNRKCPAS